MQSAPFVFASIVFITHAGKAIADGRVIVARTAALGPGLGTQCAPWMELVGLIVPGWCRTVMAFLLL